MTEYQEIHAAAVKILDNAQSLPKQYRWEDSFLVKKEDLQLLAKLISEDGSIPAWLA